VSARLNKQNNTPSPGNISKDFDSLYKAQWYSSLFEQIARGTHPPIFFIGVWSGRWNAFLNAMRYVRAVIEAFVLMLINNISLSFCSMPFLFKCFYCLHMG
jgi:hypothetical protein